MPTTSETIISLLQRSIEGLKLPVEQALTDEHALLIAKRILTDLQWAGLKIVPIDLSPTSENAPSTDPTTATSARPPASP